MVFEWFKLFTNKRLLSRAASHPLPSVVVQIQPS
jgi:hypothetical protein